MHWRLATNLHVGPPDLTGATGRVRVTAVPYFFLPLAAAFAEFSLTLNFTILAIRP
jgi:hypothetical protein